MNANELAERIELERLIGIRDITERAGRILRDMEPTPIYNSVVADLGDPMVQA